MKLSDQQKTTMGFFSDSPYMYRMDIGIGEKGFTFESDDEGVGVSEKADKPYVKNVLRRYIDVISRGLECEFKNIDDIGKALREVFTVLPYSFSIDIRRKSNKAGVAYMKSTVRKSVRVSDQMHKPATKEVIQDFIDALSFALDLPEYAQ
jgi:hypothetical protein